MEDTESSDFLSSSGSLFSSFSTGSASSDQEDPNDTGFDVFLSDGLTETTKAEEDFENVRMIPNSRLSSADHPVLIRLENEYQARRASWNRHTGEYCRYTQETEGWTTCQSKDTFPNTRLTNADHPVLVRLENEYQARRSIWHHHTGQYSRCSPETEGRTSSPNKNKLGSGGSPLGAGYRRSPESNLEAPQRLKRQRNQDAESPSDWWRDRKEQNLPLSDGDRVFARKCRELQGFIKPLTDLLNGLKRGRYERGLSSFQQSLAMDRIQRIVGVLQKPEMGERYLSTLLQVEMMLKVWFPGVTSSSSSSSSLELDIDEPQNKMAKHPDVGSTEQQSSQIRPPPCLSSSPGSRPSESRSTASATSECVCCEEGVQVLAEVPTMNMTWMHTSPICNPPQSQVDLHHLNTVFGSNRSGCGIIFLVQKSQALTPATTVSVDSEERPLDRKPEQRPPRGQSAPPVIVPSDSPDLGQLKSHCHSLPNLSARMQTSGGEKT